MLFVGVQGSQASGCACKDTVTAPQPDMAPINNFVFKDLCRCLEASPLLYMARKRCGVEPLNDIGGLLQEFDLAKRKKPAKKERIYYTGYVLFKAGNQLHLRSQDIACRYAHLKTVACITQHLPWLCTPGYECATTTTS